MDFERPDTAAFPCLRLAQEAITQPGGMCVLNAANELAVAAFLERAIGFTDIDQIIEKTLETITSGEPQTLGAVEDLDDRARLAACEHIARLTSDSQVVG
jgi:1-deoxy-D-xylulose-5-phosphate reductoisomerase